MYEMAAYIQAVVFQEQTRAAMSLRVRRAFDMYSKLAQV